MPHLTSTLTAVDDVLRGRVARPGQVAVMSVTFAATYGFVMGTYGGLGGDRALQAVFAAVKVPVLLGLTFAIALPSFFVLNTLLGVRGHFGHALRALMATQAGLTAVLASLAPVTLVWYATVDVYPVAVLFNAGVFGLASLAAQRLLRRAYAPLIAANPVHRTLLRAWLGLYAFVGIQLGWTLRPFVGDPLAPVQFFRTDAWGNAYVEVGRIAWQLVR